jgi:thymidylate synthase
LQFPCLSNAYSAIFEDILNNGEHHTSGVSSLHPESGFRELRNVHFELLNARARLLTDAPNFDFGLAAARAIWHVLGRRSEASIQRYSGGTSKFLDANGNFGGSAYGAAMFESDMEQTSQFAKVVQDINTRPNTKRAYMTFADRVQAQKHSNDLACMTSLQFFPRGGLLHATLTARANNFLRLFLYNLFEMTVLHELVAVETDYELGSFYYFCGSVHAYESDISGLIHGSQSSSGAHFLSDAPSMSQMTPPSFTALSKAEAAIRSAVNDSELVSAVQFSDKNLDIYWSELLRATAIRVAVREGWNTAASELRSSASEWYRLVTCPSVEFRQGQRN